MASGWPVYFYLNTYYDKARMYPQIPMKGSYHALDQGYWYVHFENKSISALKKNLTFKFVRLGWHLYSVVNPFPPVQFSLMKTNFRLIY